MGRLFDEIKEFRPFANQMQVIDITNVFEYHLKVNGDISNSRIEFGKTYPNIAPPLYNSFFEINAKVVNSIYGINVISFDNGSDDCKQFVSYFIDKKSDTSKDFINHISNSRWVCACFVYAKQHGNLIRPFNLYFAVMGDGRIVERNDQPALVFEKLSDCPDDLYIEQLTTVTLNPYFLAVSFMHCKNVQRVEHTSPPKVQARRAKEGKPPLTKYYTLEIDPMKRVLQTEGNISANGLKRALHICRGHFATYTEDKPLFGKVKGTFWVSQHVRGSKDVGEIVKGYTIKPPT